MNNFDNIIMAELITHGVRVCRACSGINHRRGCAFVGERVIHYSRSCKTRSTLFGFLHEIGHIVCGHGRNCKLRSYEKETEAEDYARCKFKEYGIPIPRKRAAKGRAYIIWKKRHGDRIKKSKSRVMELDGGRLEMEMG